METSGIMGEKGGGGGREGSMLHERAKGNGWGLGK